VRLWKLQSRTSPLVLRGASDGITSVAFSPDQQMLLAASQEGTCRVYCTTFDGILALAQQRVTRRLTSAERMLYLEQEKERGP
jgi:WD40 repeat protein